MIRADEKLASALCQLHHNDDFAVVRDWLFNSLQHYLEQLPMAGRRSGGEIGNVCLPGTSDPLLTAFQQGYCVCLQDIKDRMVEPRKLADKFKK